MLSRSASLALTLLPFTLFAQQPTLVKDINPTGSSGVDALTCSDGKVYFRANDGTHGAEPWVSDGTAAGTFLLRDINPDAAQSYPGPFVPFNGHVYFGADNGVNGEQLWMTDGTTAGTVVVPEIYEGFTNAVGFTVFNGRIYFQGTTDATSAELWATDGTVAGTHLVKDIRTGTEGSYPGHFMAFGDRLFFSADDGVSGNELWATDGTEAGTVLIKDITSGSSNPNDLAVLGSKLFFAAYDLAAGGEPWVSDGTTAGTVLLKDINPSGDSAPQDFCAYNGRMYFGAGTSATGGELWVSDGTTAGTTRFMDIFPGTTSSQARRLTTAGGWLYFSAMGDYDDATQLWRTDGTEAGTGPVVDGAHTPGPLNSNNGIVGCGGQLFFDAGFSVAIGEELYTLALPTGVDEEVNAPDHALLWPNPTAGVVHLDAIPGGRVSVLTPDGRVVLEHSAESTIDISALPDGIYVARLLMAGSEVRVQRVVKAGGR